MDRPSAIEPRHRLWDLEFAAQYREDLGQEVARVRHFEGEIETRS